MGKASVSVLIPYYNARLTIERAINSIVKQTMLPDEVIIIDDCSIDKETDGVLHKIKEKYSGYFRVVLLKTEKNMGPGSARNRGWEAAKSRYVAFLDADDAWHPQKIEIQYKIMENDATIKISCHRILVEVNYDSKISFEEKNTNEVPFFYNINKWKTLFKHNATGTSTVMIDRDIQLRFTENMRYAEDYLLYLKILFTYRGIVIDEVLCRYFKELYGASGLTGDLWKLEKGELKCFYLLAKEKYIPNILLVVLFIWSYLKYLRRVLIKKLRN